MTGSLVTGWTPCPADGPAGFDLDAAVLVSPDVLDGDLGSWTSRATATQWRETLWRTASGDHVVGLDSGGPSSSGLDVDRWRWVSPVVAEDWLRRQGLQECADAAFGPLFGRPAAAVAVHLHHRDRVRLEQACEDDGVSVQQLLHHAVAQLLDRREQGATAEAAWWPRGVVREQA